jgi:hypothetical protein
MELRETLAKVISTALGEASRRGLAIYTIALYYDHESHAVSVCIDTEESSAKSVRSMNAYNMKYFHEAVDQGDLADAALWQANIGRSLSLGDFALVGLCRTDLGDEAPRQDFFVEMARSLMSAEPEVLRQAGDPDRVLFACSTADDEVGLAWSRLERSNT